MKTNLSWKSNIVHHSCHLLYHKMTGKPVCIFMNTSLLTYAYTWQTFCTLRNGNILTYQTAHTHTQTQSTADPSWQMPSPDVWISSNLTVALGRVEYDWLPNRVRNL